MASYEQLLAYARERVNIDYASDVIEEDADIVAHLLDECELTVSAKDRFFVRVNCVGITQWVSAQRAKRFDDEIAMTPLAAGVTALAYTGLGDFSHTNTEWQSVITLGIAGLRERVSSYAQQEDKTAQQRRFYAAVLRVYDAALRMIARAADIAEHSDRMEMAQGLRNLATAPPRTLFEAMQTVIIYYVLQTVFDGTYLRTLGRLDAMLIPFWQGQDRDSARAMLEDFMLEIDRLDAPSNIPFAIGGTDEKGASAVNELSYALLNAYLNVPTHNTKFHLLIAKDTPEDIVLAAMDGVRRGNNSVVFMSDEMIIRSLERLGIESADARRYHVVGCYECGGEGELTCSCNARVNLPKALEAVLFNGKDAMTGQTIGLENEQEIDSFDALCREWTRQVRYFCRCAMQLTDVYERNYRYIHSSPIFSGAYTSALEKGGDLYSDYTAKYNNSSLNAIGLGTVVDALAAIRKLVYEDKTMTLAELIEVLNNDWKDHELLRLRIRNKFPRYGIGDTQTDALAREIVDVLDDEVSGKPNAKGGLWRLGTFSINWRWEFGEKTAASANGRHAGETLSQNSGASFGADTEGATAHLWSVTAIDAVKTPNGTIADIDLHASAVRGDNGLRALTSSLLTYFDLGGFAVHYNVLDTETLKKAKQSPADYPNLQVRLCGWNVLFSSLSDKEKDEFIARSCHEGGGV